MADAAHTRKPTAPEPARGSDLYDRVRSQIDAENQLSNVRVIWLLIAEAFFVGGYATTLNAQEKAKNALFSVQQDVLLWAVPVAALLAAALAFAAVFASMKRVQDIKAHYGRYEEQTTTSDMSTSGYPPIQDTALIHRLTHLSLLGMPTLFMALWTVVLVMQISQRLFEGP